jgi:uncharacterized protein
MVLDPVNPIDPKIIHLIRQHHIFTLATSFNDNPWCASCFYVYLEDQNLFVFTTNRDTRHGKYMLGNNQVAGNIALETRMIGKIRGIQFNGEVKILEGEELKIAHRSYLLRFPVAVLMDTLIWGLSPSHIKMTDNRLGFGKKLIWNALPEKDVLKGIH